MNDLSRSLSATLATAAAFSLENAQSLAVTFSAVAAGVFSLMCIAEKTRKWRRARNRKPKPETR